MANPLETFVKVIKSIALAVVTDDMYHLLTLSYTAVYDFFIFSSEKLVICPHAL